MRPPASASRPFTPSASRCCAAFPWRPDWRPHFDLLDDRTAAELLGEARQSVLLEAGRDPRGPLGRALATLVEYMDERGFAGLIQAALNSRRRLDRVPSPIMAASGC